MRNGKPLILYIDDDQDFLDAMRVQLEARGFEMSEASSAEDGVRAFAKERPDLVLVDLMMEEVDAGTHLVAQLRAQGSAVPIVMVSSVGDNLNMTTDFTQLGLTAVFQKPVDPDSLASLIRAKLRR